MIPSGETRGGKGIQVPWRDLGAWGKGQVPQTVQISFPLVQPNKEPGLFSVPPGSSDVQHPSNISGHAQGGGGEYPLSSMCSCIVMYDVRSDII